MIRNAVILLVAFTLLNIRATGAESAFTFTNVGNRFAPVSGPATLAPWDPDATNWSAAQTLFGTATSFGIPAPPGGDKVVMRFPACTNRQGYELTHTGTPNGVYGEGGVGLVSNYTLIFDVLYPASSDAQWRSFYQANPSNTDEGEIFLRNTTNGGVGINGDYRGSVTPNAWHRVVITMRSAPGEGQLHRYIDGVFVGGLGTTGSGMDIRWALNSTLLLLTDDSGETAPGFLCGFYFTDRQMVLEEVRALGGVNSEGPTFAGAPAPPLPQQLPRFARGIGHRGASGSRPENTLPSLVKCFEDGAHAIETDIRISADGQVVVFHDSTLDRTTNGTGNVSSYTVAQLKAFDAGSWFDLIYTGTRIPTLVEYMQALPPGKILYLDVKITTSAMVTALRQAFNAASFSEDRWWIYVYDNTTFAQQVHAEFPNSIIVWEGLPANWQTNPTAFNNLKAIGVGMFDFGGNGGALSPALALRLKQEGLLVATYTILDPDNMVLSAVKGADFMETDFTSILSEITPPRDEQAKLPNPPDGAINVSPTILSWYDGTGTLGSPQRIYFGSEDPPQLVSEQYYDLFGLQPLLPATTYYWSVKELTTNGIFEGPVWTFTTPDGPQSAPSALYEWNFDGNLASSMGAGVLDYSDGATESLVSFAQTNGGSVPHIGGQTAGYLRVPSLTGTTNGLAVDLAASAPNGGGAYINQYTIIMDVFSPGAANWQALFNTQPANTNDADWYIHPNGSLGIAAIGYSVAGIFTQNTWHRIIFSADLAAGRVTYYLNGAQVFTRTNFTGQIDGRYSLYSNQNTGPDVLLLNEGDTTGVYTHEIYLGAFAILDREISNSEAAALGGPQARGIYSLGPNEIPKLKLTLQGNNASLTWQPVSSFHLQRTLNLLSPWQDVPNTAGMGNFTEPRDTGGRAYYRLYRP